MKAVFQTPFTPLGCKACREGQGLDFSISMAFQPIWDSMTRTILAQEALVRGSEGQGASWVFEQVHPENLYAFDQICRVTAIRKAAELGLDTHLNINFLPNAVYKPDTCIRATLEASKEFGFPPEKIVFEVTETEKISDEEHLVNIFSSYKKQGFSTAIDDFGAGYSGLKLLTRFVPDYLKIDMEILREIHIHKSKQIVVQGILDISSKLGCSVIAEGIETKEEMEQLESFGVRYFQGYYIAKPEFEALPRVVGV